MKTARQIRIEVFGKCTIDDLDDLEKMSREVDNAIILAQTEAFIEGKKEGISEAVKYIADVCGSKQYHFNDTLYIRINRDSILGFEEILLSKLNN